MGKFYNGVVGPAPISEVKNNLDNTGKPDLTATPVIEAKATVTKVLTKYHPLSPE